MRNKFKLNTLTAGWTCTSGLTGQPLPVAAVSPVLPRTGQRLGTADPVARCAPRILGVKPADPKPAPLRAGFPCDGNTVLM